MPAARDLAFRIVQRLRSHRHQAYLVGGCVRDLILGQEPKDYDVATSARPQEILNLFPGSGLIGAHFGVVMVREDHVHVEVATFRSDHDYRDGRRPERVLFETDPKSDVERRDFTVNSLLMDPETGEIADYTGGRADLQAGVIRTVGDPGRRFAEDHLRMMRAVRFAARLGFRIHGETMDAIRRMPELIRVVSAERVQHEIARILLEGGARYGFELLDESGLLAEILPEVAAMKGVQQPPEYHPEGDVWTHTLIMLEMMRQPSLELALGVLLHDVAKPPTFRRAERIRFDGHAELGAKMSEEILGRLRFPAGVIRQVESLVANHLRFKDVKKMKESTLKRFLRMDRFVEHLELHRLDCESSHGLLGNWHFVSEKLAALPAEALRPKRLLSGEDLIAAGFAPGPRFKSALDAVESAQLEGRVSTKEEAFEIAHEQLARSGESGT
jgi:poly(A) polymerase